MVHPGDKHYTASVLLLTDAKPTKVLLVHHKKLDKWIQPGGHQETYENYYEAAIREVREETGVDIRQYMPVPKRMDEFSEMLPKPDYILEERIPAYGDQPEHYHLDITFIVRLPEFLPMHEQSGAHDISWFTADEVESLKTFDELKAILREEMSR